MSKSSSGPPRDRRDKDLKTTLTPALRQYFETKQSCPDCILFFQMGDFYELFFEDALLAAPLLDLTLTSRQKLAGEPVPLCGVPLSAVEGYINRLVAQGHKVAVCDQKGSPGPGAGLAQRYLSRIVTPATVLSAEGQSPALPKYLAALYRDRDEYAVAAIDVSTGDFIVGRFDDFTAFQTTVRNIDPAEILLLGEEADPAAAASFAPKAGSKDAAAPWAAQAFS
ncbi:MAG: hypothetical protein LBJ64_02110, partial [Deltaproteobacteria bacterium]|nr:hypothetical protein [Deltaproteobacteria bacterium]